VLYPMPGHIAGCKVCTRVSIHLVAYRMQVLLLISNSIQRVRITRETFSFLFSYLTFDANIGRCDSYFFHPLLCIIKSRPIGAINTEVPGVGVASLPANNFHGS
jgi:hypothetical protein